MKYRVYYKGISLKDGPVASDMIVEASSIDDAVAKAETKLSKKNIKVKESFQTFALPISVLKKLVV